MTSVYVEPHEHRNDHGMQSMHAHDTEALSATPREGGMLSSSQDGQNLETEEETSSLLNQEQQHAHVSGEEGRGNGEKDSGHAHTDGGLSNAQIQQFAVLCVMNLSEAFQINVIWPFVPNQVEWFGFEVEQVGKYVGMLAASFFLCQFISSFAWGILSDHVGRRPTLLMGLLGTSLAMLGYGFSQSYLQAMLFRSLGGLLNGNIGITKTYMGEITDSNTQSRGFSLLAFNWGIGSIIAPIVGGYLSSPVTQIPSIFNGSKFFNTFPYFLPSAASALVALVGVVLGYFYLPETEAFKRHIAHDSARKTSSNFVLWVQTRCACCKAKRGYSKLDEVSAKETEIGILNTDRTENREPTEGVRNGDTNIDKSACQQNCTTERSNTESESIRSRIFRDRNVMFGITAYALLALGTILFDELFSVFLQTPRKHQGLGLKERDAGTALTISGVGLVVYQLFFYPKLADKLGKRKMFLLGSVLLIPFFSFFPVLHWVPEGLVWPLLGPWIVIKALCLANGFTSIMILINNAAQGNNLGIVNGIAQSSSSLTRCIGPFLGGSIFSLSLTWESNPLGVFAAYVLMGLVMFVCSCFAYALPKWTDYAPSQRES
eukprot:gb/GECG01016096.1/.p1 GENE.gb/GECG01016096.1/~~gb/GECG01016096.1/.p1  ORF type:complete len:602 (+),score=47.88 gb/GECG01016096.1/:1-1806(+)